MLERHYGLPRTVDRIRALWLGPAIDRYVDWLEERHAANATIKQHVQALVEFNHFALARGVGTLDELPMHIEAFVTHWMSEHGGWCRTRKDRGVVHSHGRVPVEQMLRVVLPHFIGTRRGAATLPFVDSAPEFFPHLREERGLRPATVYGYVKELQVFAAYFQRIGISHLAKLTPPLISTFLTERAQRLGAHSMQKCSGALRLFLRYIHRQGITSIDLGRSVPRGRAYKQASVPRAIAWGDVRQVLAGVDRRSAVGKRDYALLLLLVSYGLRAREIAAMRLDDLDWKQCQLRIPTRKGGHSTIYPLSTTVGAAIIEYLRAGRPDVTTRRVFLATRTPFAPLDHYVVSQRAGLHLRAAGIAVPRAGSHTFRHTCVQHLVDAEVPFKTIGDYVGHRCEESTLVYGKIALHRLRQLVIGEAEEML